VSTFGDRTIERCRQVGNPICLGLDPRVELTPEGTEGDPVVAIRNFCTEIIDLVANKVAAVKPQAAFFEAWGSRGFAAFEEVCRHARERGLLVVADVKRGDIGTTAEAYAKAFLAARGPACALADAVTVNGFLGSDGVKPFIATGSDQAAGVFILVKTSNPSSGELQDLRLEDGRTVSEHMASLVREWNQPLGDSGYGPVGAVVGATYPGHLASLREQLPGSILLLPGYGAQGAGAEDIAAGFDANGEGALVSASRSLTYPWSKEGEVPVNWQERVLAAVAEMSSDLAGLKN